MTDDSASAGTGLGAADDGFVVTWRRLLAWAVWSAVVEYVIVSVLAKSVIPPIIVLGIVLIVAGVLLRRGGKAGVITALVGLVLFLVTNLAFALGDLAEYRSFPSFAVVAASMVSGVVGIVAAVAVLRGRGVSGAARAIALGSAAAVVGLLAVNAIASITYDDPERAATDLSVVAKDIEFTPESLTATAGPVTFYVDNKDAVLHNFHVKGVGKVSMPAAHSARKTFELKAGTYEYVCDFHPEDMKGTLTVA
jgi:plastocyanin